MKLGGSIITDKKSSYTANIQAIKTIANVLKTVKSPLLISHGSGSFGHTSAQKYGGKHGYHSLLGIAKVAKDAAEINRIVMDNLIDEGLPAISFRPQSFLMAENGVLKDSFVIPLQEALWQGLIPVVYGDVILDTKWKSTIFSGETTLNILCRFLQKKYEIPEIIELCDVDGVLNLNQETIPHINTGNWKEINKYLIKNSVTDVTGGMRHKIESALDIAQLGIKTIITNGNKRESIKKAIEGKAVGTVIS